MFDRIPLARIDKKMLSSGVPEDVLTLLGTSSQILLQLVWNLKPPKRTLPQPFDKYRDALQRTPSFYKTDLPMSLAFQYQDDPDLCMPKSNPLLSGAKGTNQVKDQIIDTLDNNTKKRRYDILTVMGVSGCGKTSSCFLVGKERYCIYIEAPDPQTNSTVYGDGLSGLVSDIRRTKALKTKQSEMEVESAIYIDIVAHVLALVSLFLHHIVKSPEDWIEAQIDGYRSYIIEIRRLLSNLYISRAECQEFLEFANNLIGHQIGWITDESHLFMSSYYGSYEIPGISDANNHWTFLQFFISTFCGLPISHILCGTHFRLAQHMSVASAVAKLKVPVEVVCLVSFPYLTPEDVKDGTFGVCLDLSQV